VRIGLVTEGGYPYVSGDAGLWCERLVRGLGQHEFDLYALSRSRQQEDEGWLPLPDQVARVRTAPLWTADDDGARYGRRARRRFTEHYGELAAALSGADRPDRPADQEPHPDRTAGPDASGTDGQADRFATALYGLADLARDQGGGLAAALRSRV